MILPLLSYFPYAQLPAISSPWINPPTNSRMQQALNVQGRPLSLVKENSLIVAAFPASYLEAGSLSLGQIGSHPLGLVASAITFLILGLLSALPSLSEPLGSSLDLPSPLRSGVSCCAHLPQSKKKSYKVAASVQGTMKTFATMIWTLCHMNKNLNTVSSYNSTHCLALKTGKKT